MNAAGENLKSLFCFRSNENSLMLRGIAPDGKSFGELYEKGFKGLRIQSLIDEVVRDSHEQCGYLLAAEKKTQISQGLSSLGYLYFLRIFITASMPATGCLPSGTVLPF